MKPSADSEDTRKEQGRALLGCESQAVAKEAAELAGKASLHPNQANGPPGCGAATPWTTAAPQEKGTNSPVSPGICAKPQGSVPSGRGQSQRVTCCVMAVT